MENTDDAPQKEGEPDKNKKRASAAALIDAFVDEYRADREQYNRRENHRVVREWLTIIFLFVAASAGIVQACIFIGQLHEMEKVYGPIKTSAEAAKSAADAALKQAGIMQGQLDAMEREQQARMSIIEPFKIPEFWQKPDQSKGTILWTFNITNSGKAEAKNLTVDTYMKIEDGRFTIGSEPAFDSQQFERLKKTDFGIWALIVFSYLDIFNKPHEVAVCTALLTTGAIAAANGEECKKQIEK